MSSEIFDENCILKRAIFQQDKKALAILYVKYHPQIKRYITFRVGCLEDAEDLVQDVFVELSKGKGHFDGHGSVASYIYGIAKKIISRYHKQKKCPIKILPIDAIESTSIHSGITPDYNKGELFFENEVRS